MTLHRLLPAFMLALDLMLLGTALAADRHNPRNRRFAFLSLALCVWTLGVLGLRWSQDPTVALLWERFLHIGVIAIPILFYEYVLLFLGQATRTRALTTGYALCAGFLVVLPTRAFMVGVRYTPWGFAPESGPLYGPFLAYFMTFMLLGLAQLISAERAAGSPFRRNRIRVVIVGVVVSLLGGGVDFGRFLFDIEWVYPLGIPASAVFAVALGVAIVRYRLMDLGAVARRALLYVLTWVTLAPLLVLAVDVLDHVLPGMMVLLTPPRKDIHAVIVFLTTLMLALPVMRKLESILDRIMFRRQHAIRDALVALNKELVATLDVDRVGRTLAEGLVERIPAVHASLYVPGTAGEGFVPLCRTVNELVAGSLVDGEPLPPALMCWLRAARKTLVVDKITFPTPPDGPAADFVNELEQRRVALVLPVFVEGELPFVLVIGEKLSGEVFNPDEIEFLEILVGHAATALKNARLYDDLKRQMEELRATRDADRAKDQFLAMLAHELRNPLGPILNATHVLNTLVSGDPRLAELTGLVRRQGQHLARLVDDLLDVSRIRSGKIRLICEPVDLRSVLAQCLDTARTSAKCDGREIQLSLPSAPLVVNGDPIRLQQVFWNLLDNALKYSAARSPVRVTAERSGREAFVRIRDHGVGIDAEVLPTIFDLFTQADTTLHRSRGGLGIGLSLVRSLVNQHGGTVSAHSAGLGHGSDFVVRLPLRAAPTVAAADPPGRLPAPSRDVLIVEDNLDACDSLRLLLETAGHRVVCARDGLSALDMAIALSPDVALVDIGLPGLDGYELARRLRGSTVGQVIHLVAVTGYGQPEDRQRALDNGFDAHLVKPVDADQLLRIIATGRAGVRAPAIGRTTP